MKRQRKQSDDVLSERLETYQPPEGHGRPITRRDFLGAGLIQGAAFLSLPTALTLLAREAQAQATGVVANPPAYLEIHAVGGAAFLASMAMTDSNRNLLGSYNMSGQGTRALAESNVVPMFANRAPIFKNSGFYSGLNMILAGQTDLLAQTVLLSLATDTNPDTSGNPMSAAGLVQSTIAAGQYLPALASHPVINQSAFLTAPSSLIVEGFQDIFNVVAPRTGDVLDGISTGRRSNITKFLKSLNETQAQRFLSRPGGAELKANAVAALSKVESLLSSSAINFDPRLDAAVNAIWAPTYSEQIDLVPTGGNYTNKGPENQIASAVIYNLAKGHATSAGLARGGYDYHGGLRYTSERYDEDLGKLIGRALLTFKALNKPAFIYVTTDGSCSSFASDAGGNAWVGDRSFNSVNFIIAYRPGVGVKVSQMAGRSDAENQIGNFKPEQVSDSGHPVASARGSAATAFVNYLNFCGIDGVNSPVMKQTLLSVEQIKMLSRILPT